MSACVILGNGPGLSDEVIPRGVIPIGVNRSYLKMWAPIACSMDSVAASEMHSRAGAFLYLVPRNVLDPRHSVAYFDAPKWLNQSGPFAIWCAVRLGFTEIHLVGFGGKGHFNGSDDKGRDYHRDSLQRVVEFASSKDVGVFLNGEPFRSVPEGFWPEGERELTFSERMARPTYRVVGVTD